VLPTSVVDAETSPSVRGATKGFCGRILATW